MSTEETNGFSAPNEDANVAGAAPTESAPAGQAAENNETAPDANDAAQASSEGATDDMSAFEEQIEDSDLAKALERIASVEDQLARVNAELYNQGQEYANYVRGSKEAIPGHKTAGQDEVIDALISVLDDIAAARAHGDLEDGPFASIATKLEDSLKKEGVERFGEVGEPFDPNIHEAVMQQPTSEVEPDHISMVLRYGYRVKERVVRTAQVAVASAE